LRPIAKVSAVNDPLKQQRYSGITAESLGEKVFVSLNYFIAAINRKAIGIASKHPNK